jgi:hypothetical protein
VGVGVKRKKRRVDVEIWRGIEIRGGVEVRGLLLGSRVKVDDGCGGGAEDL